jgi:class 3 adenylate cyclase
MFLDIRGFSKLSEKYKADEMFKILNIYLGSFSKILEENGGNVDKYI